MSHSHIRVPKPAKRISPWVTVLTGLVAAVFILLLAFGTIIHWPVNTNYSTAEGMVLETRIVVDRILDSNYGGRIYYRIEARVRYPIQGQQHDQWMTASEVTIERESLLAKLSSHPKNCLVRWVPKHSENAKCQLE
jgi:hypothetical protein